jgi:hypothetical protein
LQGEAFEIAMENKMKYKTRDEMITILKKMKGRYGKRPRNTENQVL